MAAMLFTDAERARFHAWLDALLTGDVHDGDERVALALTYEDIDRRSNAATAYGVACGQPAFTGTSRSRLHKP